MGWSGQQVDDSNQPIQARADFVGAQPFYDIETVYEEDDCQGENMKWKDSDYESQTSTPATLTLSGSCVSSSTNDTSSTSDGLSSEGNADCILSTNCAERNDDSTRKNSWSDTSSYSSSPGNLRERITATSGLGKATSRPTSSMNDQLKYYIKKHMPTPPSASQQRG